MKTANSQYKEITDTLKPELEKLEYGLKRVVLNSENPLKEDVLTFLCAPSKRIRSVLMFSILKSLNIEINEKHYQIAIATELIHNATLIHDDIIDSSDKRRGQTSWHKAYDTKLAVVVGDYFLALSLKTLAKLNSCQIFQIFSENMLSICNGEISQYFKRFELPSLEEYLKKSEQKTALLFLCAIKSALYISKFKEVGAEKFSVNFGIAFQILNDLKNTQDNSDIKNGIYTLASIYFKHKNPDCDIIETDSESFNDAKQFLNEFVDKTVDKLDFTANQKNKDILVKLCELLRG